jgi:hypothetical protein
MEKGQKFSLGAALLFEDLTGKRMADISDGLGLRETIALLYCQRFWNIKERPSLDQFTEEISASNIEALPALLNAPFFPTEVQ